MENAYYSDILKYHVEKVFIAASDTVPNEYRVVIFRKRHNFFWEYFGFLSLILENTTRDPESGLARKLTSLGEKIFHQVSKNLSKSNTKAFTLMS